MIIINNAVAKDAVLVDNRLAVRADSMSLTASGNVSVDGQIRKILRVAPSSYVRGVVIITLAPVGA